MWKPSALGSQLVDQVEFNNNNLLDRFSPCTKIEKKVFELILYMYNICFKDYIYTLKIIKKVIC